MNLNIREMLRKAVSVELVDSYADYQIYYNTVVKARQRIEAQGRAAVPELIAALSDEDYRVRGLAATLLGKVGDDRALPALREALHLEDEADTMKAIRNARSRLRDEQHIAELIHELQFAAPTARAEAIRLLSKTRENALLPHIIEALQDESAIVRDAAIRALGYGRARDASVIPHISQGLSDPDPHVRLTTIKTLIRNRSGDEGIFEALLAAADDEDVIVRRAVLVALREFSDEATIPIFLGYMDDSDFAVREAAIRGLHDISPPAALQALIAYVYSHVLPSDAPWFWMVAAALGDIGDPAAIPALIDFLQHPNDELRPAAVKALLTISHPSSVPPLLALLNHKESEIRLYAAAILGRLGYVEAQEALQNTATQDPSQAVREAADNALVNLATRSAEKADVEGLLKKLEALLNVEGLPRLEEVRKTLRDIAEHGSPRALEPLTALTQNRFPSIRRSAVMALGEMGLADAREALEKATHDSSTMVRLYARRALELIR